MNVWTLMGVLAVASVLAACGGGGSSKDATCSDFTYQEDAESALHDGATQLDGDHDGIACESLPHRPVSTPTNASPAGLWRGTTNTNRTVTGLVFSDGTYYVMYSAIANPAILAGVVQGGGSISGSSFTSGNARDFNVEGLGMAAATVSASVATKQSFNGSISYQSGQATTFSTAYNSQFEIAPTLSAVAGTFTGQVAFSAGVQAASITVNASGAISSTSNGCTMTGTASPRSDANAYNVAIRFGAAPCFFANQSMSGIAYFDAPTKRLYAAAPNAGRTDGILFLGTKP